MSQVCPVPKKEKKKIQARNYLTRSDNSQSLAKWWKLSSIILTRGSWSSITCSLVTRLGFDFIRAWWTCKHGPKSCESWALERRLLLEIYHLSLMIAEVLKASPTIFICVINDLPSNIIWEMGRSTWTTGQISKHWFYQNFWHFWPNHVQFHFQFLSKWHSPCLLAATETLWYGLITDL